MLNIIFDALYLLKEITQFCLIFSYKTGQTIVAALTILLEVFVYVTKNVQTLIYILLEDFRLFWHDIHQLLILFSSTITNIAQNFAYISLTFVNAIRISFCLIVFGASYVHTSICELINFICILFASILMSIKQCLVLLGSTVWLIVSLVPIFIVYICTTSTYYVGVLFTEVLDLTFCFAKYLKKISVSSYSFIFDFPIDSLVGLIVGFAVMFAVFKMQIVLYQQSLCFRLFKSFLVRMKAWLFAPARHTASENTNVLGNEHVKNNFCIICQERDKCILMLPCKHLCICNSCNLRLQHYQYVCPICRTTVQKTIKVFT